ncbi:MAG: hypothetical protein C0436_04670 [Alphaproteobacteria bacterium]|nr:hypothetical protein [Alphaproteobacteria bacterium]
MTLWLLPFSAHASDEVKIIDAMFGIINQTESGNTRFTPTTKVPHVVNQEYGWVIMLQTSKPTVHWKETFTLPSAPVIWKVPQTLKHSLSKDKKTSWMEKDASLADGPFIFNNWSVAEGDPKGHYKIRVTIDNKIEREFNFEVK